MYCQKCKHLISIKHHDKFITMKCKCEIMIIYPDKTTKVINKKDYNPNYKKK